LVKAGAEGLVVYQETYDRRVYADMHTAGPKRDFDFRLETAERAYAAGFRRLGIGALYGMSDWRWEAISLAAHAEYLLRHCWKAQLTISLPRLRPCAGEFDPPRPISDRDLVQLVCALRIFLPDAGLVLSTREPARLRNGLIPLGVTMMSAGSHTEPGGYTGEGAKTVIPGEASAKVSFRLVGDQDPEKIRDAFRAFVRSRLPADCKVEFGNFGLAPAIQLSFDNPALTKARAVLADEWGHKAVAVGAGGSIPIVADFKNVLGMDSLLVGFALDDDRVHSPNEKFDLTCYHKGIRSWARILDALSAG